MSANICVVGSSNIDLTARVPRLPKLGETLIGHTLHLGYGGKGANQAIAAAKLGVMLSRQPIFSQLPQRPMAHCPTLVVLPDETLLAAWFGGSYETASDVVILASRRKPLEETWSPPRVIAEASGHSVGQPVFLVRPNGELWLFFVIILGLDKPSVEAAPYNAIPVLADWKHAQPFLQKSRDGGETWDAPQQLFDYPGLMFRSRPLVLKNRIIVPAYDENTWQSRMMISDDDGKTWRLTAPLSTPQGNIHPTLVRLADGRVLAYLRTGGKGGVIWRTESRDDGETWSQPTATNIPNPNSSIDLMRLQSGALLLAYNHSDRFRTPLCLALAEEDEQWRWRRTLEDAPGEFSYPTLAQTKDGLIHLVYTFQRKHIQYACFTENWIREKRVEE